MAGLDQRRLGGTGLCVSSLCSGGGVLGSMPAAFGYAVEAERGIATVRRALNGPLTFIDTSAGYSDGESERRIGAALREHGGLPDGYVLATKVDPDPATGAFDGAACRKSAEASLERLGVDSFHLLHLHDPERIGFERAMEPGGPVETLLELRREGIAQHMGVAGGPIDLLRRFVATGAFEVVLTHNRYTLLDRSAAPLIAEAYERGLGVLNAAPFGGGLLSKGPGAVRTYAYRDAADTVLDRVRAMEQHCARFGVPLAAAALQFSIRDRRVASTIVGMSTPERVDRTVELATMTIPEELWPLLDEHVRPEDEWLG